MKTIIKIAENRWVQHITFWILYLGPEIYSLLSKYGSKGIIPSAGIVLITLPLCYFNLYFLIPKYLLREKSLAYSLLLLSLTFFYALLWTSLYWICLRFLFHSKTEINVISMYFNNLLEQSVTIAITTALKLSKDWFRQYQRNKELVTQTLYSEIRLLKAQINPHFLFNTLNNLYALTLKKSDLAPGTVLRLSYIMEYMIYESNEPIVLLEKEIKYLNDYIDLERLRQTEQTEIAFKVSGTASEKKIAPLLLLPFVENAFKHGVNKIANGAFLNIEIDLRNNEMEFIVENNQPSKAEINGHEPNGGFGIKNVIKRLDLIYPNSYKLIIDDNPGFYKISLALNLS